MSPQANVVDALPKLLQALSEHGGTFCLVHHGGGDWAASLTTTDHPHDMVTNGFSALEVVSDIAKDLP